MKTTKFGIEIEFTGITREKASKVAQEFLGGERTYEGTYYHTYAVTTADGRKWKFMSDGSIATRKKENGSTVCASNDTALSWSAPSLPTKTTSKPYKD